MLFNSLSFLIFLPIVLVLYFLTPNKNKQFNFNLLKLNDVFYNLENDQGKFIKLEFNKIPEILRNHQLVVSLFPKYTTLLSNYSKKKRLGSDNFYITNFVKNNLDVGSSKILIKKLDTKITESDLRKLKKYFYKQNDTLKLSSYEIKKE